MPTCDKLKRLNASVAPGEVKQFDPFTEDFCLTDLVLDLWTIPDGLDSKASCGISLVASSGTEILFSFSVDKYGRRVHLNSGIVCPKGSSLAASGGFSPTEKRGSLKVLLTGYAC